MGLARAGVIRPVLLAVSIVAKILHVATRPLAVLPRAFCAVHAYLSFTPRPDDIYIVTYPRSGTTWMRMILYQLTTDGTMDIQHIAQSIPFLEMAMIFGRDVERLPSPRIFKTHFSYRWIPKPGRYIYVTRDEKDVAISYFHFYNTLPRRSCSFDSFLRRFLSGRVLHGAWFKHVSSWQRNATALDMLHLTYEDLVRNLEESVRQIAKFCRFELSEERLRDILPRCTFEFMKRHETKIDHPNEVLLELGFSTGKFIRQGKIGSWREMLTSEQRAVFEARAALRKTVAPGAAVSAAKAEA
jgi:Sulfotransferase domain